MSITVVVNRGTPELVVVNQTPPIAILQLNRAIVQFTGSSGGVADGDKGDITVSGGGNTWSLNNLVVTLSKLAASAYSALNSANTLVQRDANGSFAIGNINYSTLTLPNVGVLTGANLTTSTTTPNQLLDSFDINDFRSAKYTVQIESGTEFNVIEYLVLHNGLDPPKSTRYAQVPPIDEIVDELAVITFDINGTNLRMLVTPKFAITKFKVFRITMEV